MTESALGPLANLKIDLKGVAKNIFASGEPAPLEIVNILRDGRVALVEANGDMGLALSNDEIDYLVKNF
jgi:phosphoribosylformylglycinamidine synthase